jgi:hypothetical protein
MNVSIAKDVGTTVTGIQTAITLYTLVTASLMTTGGKVGQRRRRCWTHRLGSRAGRSLSVAFGSYTWGATCASPMAALLAFVEVGTVEPLDRGAA